MPDAPATVDGRHAALPPVVAEFAEAGVLGRFEVQLVEAFGRLVPGARPHDLLALGLVAGATRAGHVCVEVDRLADLGGLDPPVPDLSADLPWPTPEYWLRSLADSQLVAVAGRPTDGPLRPLVLDGRRLYLQRYWTFEVDVTGQITDRRHGGAVPIGGPGLDGTDLESVLDRLFGGPHPDDDDRQRLAASRALRHRLTVITGGPGTGKTHTVARILAAARLLAARGDTEVRVALAAPTGKAAMRMRTAVRAQVEVMAGAGMVTPAVAAALCDATPSTIHRLLLQARRSSGDQDTARFLPFDLIVVDETSMVSLPLMARLLAAVGPETRLVLVGDPFQLASIEAGTVMDDVVGPGDDGRSWSGAPLEDRVTALTRRHRFGDDSGIARLADAVRSGDAGQALRILAEGRPDVEWLTGDAAGALGSLLSVVVASSVRAADAALAGRVEDALEEVETVKVLAATHHGPFGRTYWSDRIEGAVSRAHPGAPRLGRIRVGTPIMVTGNDRANGLFNGDVGVVVATDAGPRVAVAGPDGIRLLPLSRIGQWETWWATTIHKSQGSEFSHAVVSLPSAGSRILTRELLYTAVTRARDRVTVVGDEEAVRAAVNRPVARASGLRDRLWPGA